MRKYYINVILLLNNFINQHSHSHEPRHASLGQSIKAGQC